MAEAGKLVSDRGLRVSTLSRVNKQNRGCLSRNWDDEFVLKHQLPALIPAFDPRPGRTNVNQVSCIFCCISRSTAVLIFLHILCCRLIRFMVVMWVALIMRLFNVIFCRPRISISQRKSLNLKMKWHFLLLVVQWCIWKKYDLGKQICCNYL